MAEPHPSAEGLHSAEGLTVTVEDSDPWCLRPGEAAELLGGHPWRRFVVIGDSVAEGVGDPVPGYPDLPWCERVATELQAVRPELKYHNFGTRNRRAAVVRAIQLPQAVALRPDLAMVCAGGFDALKPTYRPDEVDLHLTEMIGALQAAGALVVTHGLFDLANCPAVHPRFRPALANRFRELAGRTAAIAALTGAVHVDLTGHPTVHDVSLYSADGLHGNLRSHAISAALAIRRLGEYLRVRSA